MQNDEIYTVKIEKMINEGRALARIDNFPIFIDGGCPEDILKVKIKKVNKKYAISEIEEIITPSPHRQTPECPFHAKCGSCNWQHINYNEQLKQKKNIVYETIKNITGIDFKIEDTIASPKIYEYRCKVQLPVSETMVSKRILTGYYKKNSHELINIKCCKLHPQIINEINEDIKSFAQKLNISAYNEKTKKGLLRHIIYRISSDLSQLLIIFVINSTVTDDKLKQIADYIMSKYPIIVGVCTNYNIKNTNVIMSDNTKIIKGNDYYIEKLDNIKYTISANSFFQVNPYCAKLIFDKVKSIINIESPAILDAYSGVSSFGIWLSSIAKKVVCIEEVQSATNDAEENIRLNNINNIEIINGDASENFKKLIDNKEKFNISIIDPPRKGSSEDAINYLVNLTSQYIIYVSCNVSTLARDMKQLISKGFYPKYIQPFDMFPNTYHVETLCLFSKID